MYERSLHIQVQTCLCARKAACSPRYPIKAVRFFNRQTPTSQASESSELNRQQCRPQYCDPFGPPDWVSTTSAATETAYQDEDQDTGELESLLRGRVVAHITAIRHRDEVESTGFLVHFLTWGGMVPPPQGGGLCWVWGECRFLRDNGIEYYCVFHHYLQTASEFEDIL